ncbi:MAG: pentapeptide repeat-containing protein [[Eubacterium] siraeum]
MNSDFSESYFKACLFTSCKAVGTAFKYSFYKNVSFDGGSFELSDFQRSKLQTVAVTDTDFSSALFSSCEIKQTELKNVTLARSVFFGTKLAGLDFTSCNIEGLTVSDTGAELKGAKVDVWQAAMFAKLLGLIIE